MSDNRKDLSNSNDLARRLNTHVKNGEKEEALRLAQTGIVDFPQDRFVCASATKAFAYLGEWSEARQNAERGLVAFPEDHAIRNIATKIYVATNRRGAALESADAGIRQFGAVAESHGVAARAFFMFDRMDDAISRSLTMQEKFPDNFYAHLYVAKTCTLGGLPDRAGPSLNWLAKVVDQSSTAGHIALAQAMMLNGEEGLARKHLALSMGNKIALYPAMLYLSLCERNDPIRRLIWQRLGHEAFRKLTIRAGNLKSPKPEQLAHHERYFFKQHPTI